MAARVLQVLLFLQEEEEESSPETQMKTNKGTPCSLLHHLSFLFLSLCLFMKSPPPPHLCQRVSTLGQLDHQAVELLRRLLVSTAVD